jgi:hypothetical protein
MARARWLFDQSSADVKEHDFVPYPDEISKMLEENRSFLLAGLMSCDVGGGRVVRWSQRHGLVQNVKEDPGRWRKVKREVLYPDDAIHVTTAARPAPPTSSLPPASAPAPPSLTGQASTNTLLEEYRRVRAMDSFSACFSAGGPSATAPLAAVLASVSRDELHGSDAAAEPPFLSMYPMFQRAVTPPPTPRAAAGMPEPRSASPPARTGKKRDCGDDCSDFEELQPPPAKLPAVRARPVAKPKADGSWPVMSSRVWGPRTVSNEARNDLGEIDADGLWRFVNDRQMWRRDRKPVTRGLRDKGLISLGTRDDGLVSLGTRIVRNAGLISLGTRAAADPEVKRAWEEKHEQMVGGRRASRGPGWDVSQNCADMLKAGLSHVIEIALSHPEHGPFVWNGAGEALMAPQRKAVAARIDAKFGPSLPLASLNAASRNVNSLLTLVGACNRAEQIMIVDTEWHRYDDTAPVPRWKAGAVYDLAIALVQWDGQVVESRRWLDRHGAVSEAQFAEARGFLAARPKQLVCCWGSAEFEFFRSAGRKPADGTDGFDVRECILQVLPGMRNLATADDTRRFSLSMDLLTPLFGLRAAPFHTALCDCEGEAVIITAFIRHLCSSQRMPPPPPSATSAKHLPPPAWDEDDEAFE